MRFGGEGEIANEKRHWQRQRQRSQSYIAFALSALFVQRAQLYPTALPQAVTRSIPVHTSAAQ